MIESDTYPWSLSLSGLWQFRPGPDMDWSEIQVPGCWEAQGYPMRPDGPARYRKEIDLPENVSAMKLLLKFGAVSYACTVFWNGTQVGSHRGMWTPFEVDVTQVARPGEKNLLELEVYKPGQLSGARYPFRSSLAGFIPDIATTFGGIWQPVSLVGFHHALDDLQVTSDVQTRTISVRCSAGDIADGEEPEAWVVELLSPYSRREATRKIPFEAGQTLDVTLPVNPILHWSPEHPFLYKVQVSLERSRKPLVRVNRRIGFRRLEAHRNRLLLNGQPLFIRGILSWGWDPQRIAPDYGVDLSKIYDAEFKKILSLGFNCLKLCLFVPNPEFYAAADRAGLLLWQELPMWLPDVNEDLRRQAPLEYTEIARLGAAHPSLILYSLGCEMNRTVDADFISALDSTVREQAAGALVCDNSGSGESYGGLDSGLADFTDYHPYYDLHFFEPLLSHWRRDWQPPRPWIFGEFSDSDTFRDLDEIIRANGGAVPWWMTRQNPVTDWRSEAQALLDQPRRMAALGLKHTPQDIIRVSHAQAFIIRKYTFETLRRRAGMGGYVVTGLRDTPISTSGVLDDLGRPKWESPDFQEINGDILICLDTGRRRTWHSGGDRPEPLDPYTHFAGSQAGWQVIIHCSRQKIPAGSPCIWTLTGPEMERIARGSFPTAADIFPGRPAQAGSITINLPSFPQAEILRLEVTLDVGTNLVKNAWDIWVYPYNAPLPPGLFLYDPSGLLPSWGEPLASLPSISPGQSLDPRAAFIATTWDPDLRDCIEAGGRVLLLQPGTGPLPARRLPFWREAIKLFEDHPVWQGFPHHGYTGLQFFAIASDLAFDTSRLSQFLGPQARILPILRRLDAREFHLHDYLLEARLGRGKLLACSLALQGGAGAQPTGFRRNVAGAALLTALVQALLLQPE